MSEFNNYRLILEELDATLSQVDNTEYERFANDVIGADRIFTAGKGRSGFVANSFAMRLNQLGKNAYVVGESTTPSIKEHDLFIIISGSGSTEQLHAGTKHDVEGSKQPLGSLFEQASLIFLDSIVLPLMDAFHISEKAMQENHANLE
ncbi:MAG: SIS domain-containing protein [Staphylococcus epidermidis]|nr:SIS domain-containing protein [Staphylococcus epidermidis]